MNRNCKNFLKNIAIGILFFVSSCRCNNGNQNNSSGAGKDAGELRIAIWSNYISDEVIRDFEGQTGIKLVIAHFSSNEELLAKLQAGATGYDIIVPSDYMVSTMRELNLLHPIDKSLLPNLANIEPIYLKKEFDPTNEFSLPYCWTVTGIAVNTEKTKQPVSSWRTFFATPDLAGQLSMLDDARESIGAALKMRGKSLNSTNAQDLMFAKEALIAVRPRVKAFTSEPLDSLLAGDISVAHIYSSDAMQARRDSQGKIAFAIPEEGATMAIDNLAILATAKNVAAAHTFINFVYQPSVNKIFVENVLAGPVVAGVHLLVKKELVDDPVLFPTDAVRARLEMIHDLGADAPTFDRLWTEIKATN